MEKDEKKIQLAINELFIRILDDLVNRNKYKSISAFAKDVEIKESKIKQIKMGASSLSVDDIHKLNEKLGIPYEFWFNNLTNSESAIVELKTNKINVYSKNEFILPFFANASAGYIVGWGDFTHDVYLDGWYLDNYREQLVRGFVVFGDSMSPFLSHGDIVFCKRVLDMRNFKIHSSDVYVIISTTGIHVKHLRDADDSFVFIPFNRMYPQEVIQKEFVYELWICEKKLSNMRHSI